MALIPKPFYFMRHGQTEWNIKRLLNGHTDIPLNEVGHNQALNSKDSIEQLSITHIYHSPLARATQTATIIAQNLTVPLIPINQLKEWHFGDWEGTASINLITNFLTIKPPNGEAPEELIDRVKKIINHILQEAALPLIIAHGGTYLALCHLMNISPDPIDNCQLLHFVPPTQTYERWSCYFL